AIGPPIIETNLFGLFNELNTGEISEHELIISNEGESDLNWHIARELMEEPDLEFRRDGPARDDAGDVLDEIEVPFSQTVGMTWDGELMWAISGEENPWDLFALDPLNREIVRRIRLDINPRNIVWDGEHLLITSHSDGNTALNYYNADAQLLNTEILPYNSVNGMTYNQDDYLIITSNVSHSFHIIDINDLQEIATVEQAAVRGLPEGAFIYSLAWVPGHEDGNLWAKYRSENQLCVGQILIDDNWNFSNTPIFQIDNGSFQGFEHDGRNFWSGGPGNENVWQIFDDGIHEFYWFDTDVREGILESGQEEELIITLDASSLDEGEYRGFLHITSNDPDDSHLEIAIELDVISAPDMTLKWDLGQEDGLINFNDYYDEVFSGGEYIVPIRFQNLGVELLSIGEIEFTNGNFEADPPDFDLDVNGRIFVNVTFSPDEVGIIEGQMIIHSNDPDEDEFEISLICEVLGAPDIEVDPVALEDELQTNSQSAQDIVIRNVGASTLNWSTFKDIVADPNRDNTNSENKRSVRSISEQSESVEPSNSTLPERDDPGDQLGFYVPGYMGSYGLDFDGNLIWGISYSEQVIWAFDPGANQIVREFDIVTDRMIGFSVDDENICILRRVGNNHRSILEIYSRDMELLDQFEPDLERGSYLTHDYMHNYYAYSDRENAIMVFNRDHEILGIVEIVETLGLENYSLRGLEWVGNHNDGHIWILLRPPGGSGDRICVQIAVDEDWDAREVQRIIIDPLGYRCMTHDGKNLILNGYSYDPSRLIVVDDGIDEPYWIAIEPEEGSVEPGEDQAAEIIFDSEDLIEGQYSVLMHIQSNDPIDPIVDVEISMTVSGVPEIELDWELDREENRISWSQYHEFVFVDQIYSVPVTVKNHGSSVLEVNRIDFDNDVFSVVPEEFEVEPREELEIEVLFSPEDDEIENDLMTIHSNDPQNEEVRVQLVGRGFLPPEIVVDPGDVQEDLLRGESSDHVFTISNEGNFPLHWNITIDKPDELDIEPGEFIRSYNTPYSQTEGLAWDGELMWGVAGQGVYALDPESGEIVFEFRANAGVDCIAFDGQNLILGGQAGRGRSEIREYDREGNLLEFWDYGTDFHSLTFDQNRYLLLQIGAAQVDIVNIRTHRRIWQFSTNDIFDSPARKMTWVPEHPDGQLWFLDEGRVYQAHISDRWIPTLVQTFEVNANENELGIGHDGENLWYGMRGDNNPLFVIHDGVDEIPLIVVEPEEGTIEINENGEFTLTLNTERIHEAGEYTAILHILSNDPVNSDIEVGITLNVNPFPAIEVNPVPEPMDQAQPIQFPDAVIGDLTEDIVITISNVGIDDLEIDEVVLENEDDFSSDLEAGTVIEENSSLQTIVTFSPTGPGEQVGRLHIFTNDQNIGEGDEVGHIWFDLLGTGLLPPQLETNPDSESEISVVAFVDDDPFTRILTISNTAPEGATTLEFDIRAIEALEEEEDVRDIPGRTVRSISSEYAGPERDDPGDLITQYDIPDRHPSGMAWDGEQMWGVTYGEDRIWSLNPEDGEIEIIAEVEKPSGITFDGTNMWIWLPEENAIGIFDLEGNQLELIDAPFEGTYALASDQCDYIFIYIRENDQIYVMTIDGREIITSFPFMHAVEAQRIYYLLWVPEHPDGQLWVSSFDTAYQLFVDTNNGDNRRDWNVEFVQSFDWEADQIAAGIGHDGENFWHGYNGRPIWYVRDDGVTEQHELSWLTVEPESGSIEPGDQFDIILFIDPEGLEGDTDYPGEIRIESNDLDNLMTIIPVTLSTGFELRHFDDFVETDSQHNLNVFSLMLGEEEALTGCEIGVFTPDNIPAGASIYVAGLDEPLIIEVYGDDRQTEAIEGFRGNEEFTFRVWDDFSDAEWDFAEAVFEDGPEVWQEDGRTLLSINGRNNRELILHLRDGWNTNSINVDPHEHYSEEDDPGPAVQRMFEQLRIDEDNHRIVLVKNEQGQFYAPDWNFDNLRYWNLTEAYQINVTEDCDAIFTGIAIQLDADIPMNPGWNLIAYFPTYNLDVSAPEYYGFSPILDFLVIAKDARGRFIAPQFNFSNMLPLRETQGYQLLIDSEEEIILNYPASQEEIAFSNRSSSRQKVPGYQDHWESTPTGQNMSVLVISERGKQFTQGNQIAAFDIEGRIVGVGSVEADGRCGLAVWGDDLSTKVIEGALPDEEFILKLWNSENIIERDLEVTFVVSGNGLVYEVNSLVVVDVNIQVAIPDDYYLSQNYPNPFNSITRIKYGLPEAGHVSLKVYDISGRIVTTLINEQVIAGHHAVEWNARQVPSGLYLLRLEVSSYLAISKVVLAK
ncbi:MAG: choice-of-anchor D domain-containing protein, partial [Calditrichaeota bacterium]|nr:choice-of-anchor D domain-containing protein [Calditrichota bacterium]